MRKIDKQNTLATKFAQAKKPTHYNSTDFRYYLDVLMMLLWCQDGLCAYTEKRVLDLSQTEIAQLFEAGEYHLKEGNKKVKPTDIFCDLEHFNSILKDAQGWDWDNLFAVDDSVNRNIKRKEEPKLIEKCLSKNWDFNEVMHLLKPDGINYIWDKYLTYNPKTHLFEVNENVEDDILADQISAVMKVLGLNCEPIKRERIKALERGLNELKEGKTPQIDEFPTAFHFCKQILNI